MAGYLSVIGIQLKQYLVSALMCLRKSAFSAEFPNIRWFNETLVQNHIISFQEVRGNGSRVLRTQEDWNEWQANTLGAAILMPQSEVDRAMWFINSRKPLTCYGWRFYDSDQVKIDTFCGVFGVSRSAAAIHF